MARIDVETITASEIEAFAASPGDNRAADGSLIIYPKRARALAHDPYAERDAPVLLIARSGEHRVGYLGLVWDRLSLHGRIFRWAWGAQFYVLPEFRHTQSAFLLLRSAVFATDGWGAWDIAAGAEKISRAMGAWEPVAVEKFHAPRVGALGDRLARRLPGVRRLLAPLARAEQASLRSWADALLAELRVGIRALERAPADLPADPCGPQEACFVLEAAKLNWCLAFPWIDSQPEAKPDPARTPPHPWTRWRPVHRLELLGLLRSGSEAASHVLLCHTQLEASAPLTTRLLAWRWEDLGARAFEAAVAVAVSRHLDEHSERLEIDAAGELRARARRIPGLHSAGAGPTFMAVCRPGSELVAAGIKDLPPQAWRLGGAEGDQMALVS